MLQNIKSASERAKKVYAFLISGFITLGIFGLWVMFGSSPLHKPDSGRTMAEVETASLFTGVKDYAGNFGAETVEYVQNMSSVLGAKFFTGEIEYKSPE